MVYYLTVTNNNVWEIHEATLVNIFDDKYGQKFCKLSQFKDVLTFDIAASEVFLSKEGAETVVNERNKK